MHNSQFMQVLHPSNNLLEILTSLIFPQPLHPHNLIKKLALGHILHNQKQLLGRFDNFIQLYNVGMPDLLQDIDLTRDSLYIGYIGDLAFFKDLDGYFLLRLVMNTQLNFTKCPLTQILTLFISMHYL